MTAPNQRTIPGLKWTGLVLGTFASLFWFLIFVLQAIEDIVKSPTPPPLEGITLSLLILLNCASMGFSWKNIQLGGLLTMVSGLAFAIFTMFTAGHNQLIATLISGFPFLLAGLLISLSMWLKSSEG